LATIKPTLQLGDIVIIMPEYQQFLNEKNNMGPAYLQTLIANPTLLRYISSADEVIYLAEIFPYVYTQTVRSFCKDLSQRDCLFCENNEQIYHRSAFNTFGDMMSHEQIHPTQEISHLYLENRQNNPNISKTISIINKFALYVEEKMGSVFLLYPATPSPSDDATYEILDYLDLRLKNELNITVVGNPSDAWYSRGFFFDTYYHLTPQGREINTERVIDYLLSILQK